MKNIIAAAALALATMTTAAHAGGTTATTDTVVVAPAKNSLGLAFVGYTEYQTEAEATEIGLGVEFGLVDRLFLTPTLVFAGTDLDTIDFYEFDLVAAYELNRMITAQGVFTLDDELNYKETRLGAVFSVGYGVEWTPEVLFDNDFDVQSLRLTAGFGITDNVGVYARVESDEDYEYAETAAGVSFKF